MKIEGYEEISLEEHNKLRGYRGLYVDDQDSNKVRYFKKVQTFPIPFKIDSNHDIDVLINGEMDFNKDDETVFVVFPEEIPLLVKAVEKAKEVIKEK